MKYGAWLVIYILIAGISQLQSQIVINEIMFNPSSDEPEWIELYNAGAETFSADTLRIEDPVRQYSFRMEDLPALHYCLLVKDTNLLKQYRNIPDSALLTETKLPGLNNDKDTLILRNATSEKIDEFIYKGSWADKGFSLERISATQTADNNSNLKQSIDADSATCGRMNSILNSLPDSLPETESVEIMPNPFSPNAGAGANFCTIKVRLSADYNTLRINVYDLNGTRVAKIENKSERIPAGEYSYVWDGRNESGYEMQPGIYPLLIEMENSDETKNFSSYKLIVIGT